MPTLYTVKQSAQLLGTSTATVRRISDEFAAHMPDYQPVTGQARKFTDSDLRTVYALLSRLKESPALTRAALLSELSAPGSEPLVIPATLPAASPATAQESPGRTKTDRAISEALDTPQNAIAPFLAAQNETQRQIETLSAQLAEIRRENAQPGPATPGRIASLVAVGALAVGIAASALLAWPQAAVIGSLIALLVHIGALSLRR